MLVQPKIHWFQEILYDGPRYSPLLLEGCEVVACNQSTGTPCEKGFGTEDWKPGKFPATKEKVVGKNHALLMKSIPVLCVDIDGKNGGIEEVGKLGHLPRTLAEISKSGTGYHLYYRLTPEQNRAFIMDFAGKSALVSGVDIKVQGLVYQSIATSEYQRYNKLPIVDIPLTLANLVELNTIKKTKQRAFFKSSQGLAKLEEKKAKEKPVSDWDKFGSLCSGYCLKEIPVGQRNDTIYQAGLAMVGQGKTDWREHLKHMADKSGLASFELKIIENQVASSLIAKSLGGAA